MSASGWDPREALHVCRAVAEAPRRGVPSPHLYVENVFSAPAYDTMLRLFPSYSVLRPWNATGASGNYARRQDIHIPREADRLEPAQRAFWLDAARFLLGPEFARTLLGCFEPYARSRFGDGIDDPTFVSERLGGTVVLNQHDPDYFLGPHTDRADRLFTVLFYFPESAGLEHLGTTLYRPLAPGFTCSGSRHHDPALFERRETFAYRANAALVFARTDVMFHGVEPLTTEQLRGSRRRGMQVQFFVRNQRPREECRTTIHATIPAEMCAGSDRQIPLTLTNRASTQLASAFPSVTGLGYRWLDEHGTHVEADNGVRTPLPGVFAPGETRACAMRVIAPRAPGRYELRLSVVQEGVAWFDDIDPDNGAAARVAIQDLDAPRIVASTVPVQAPAVPARSDIIPPTDDIALGDGWRPLERCGSGAFRWIEDGAVVHVAVLQPIRHALRVVAEPRPGTGRAPFTLRAGLADGREIGTAPLASKQTVVFALPPQSPRVFSVVLRAVGHAGARPDGSGVPDVRVFSVSVDRSADVFPAWALPSGGFYPLERNGAELFRWVGGEATIQLDPSHPDALAFDAESGPGMCSRPFRLDVVGGDGATLAGALIGPRTRVWVPLRGTPSASLVLRAQGGGAPTPGDPRTLNFRVFAPTT